MFSSVRARLTLWYTGILAFALISFALAGYFFLSYTLDRRTDDALGEVANAFAATLANDEADSHQGEESSVRRAPETRSYETKRAEDNAAVSKDGKSNADEAVK